MNRALRQRDRIVAFFTWIYVIEATTYYVRSNIVDNVFQAGCILLMIVAVLVASFRAECGIVLQKFFFLYLLLVVLGIIPDLISGHILSGFSVAMSYLFPLGVYIYLFNKYRWDEGVGLSIFKVPVFYGAFISLLGIFSEIASLAGLPISIWMENVEKTGNEVALFSVFGIPLGQYASWGSFGGRILLRIQGFYIEPSKMAMFLMIPLFFSWGLYMETRKIKYKFALVICFICFVFTMSRAGYVSFLAAVIVYKAYKSRLRLKGKNASANNKNIGEYYTTNKDISKIIFAGFGIAIGAICLIALMVALSKAFPSLNFLYQGITDAGGKANLVRNETVDSNTILSGVINQPWGYGFANTLHGAGSALDTNLANAFIMWLVTSGILGAVVAVILQLFILIDFGIPCLKSENKIKASLGMAYIGLTFHSLSYGTWMTPDYIMIVSMMASFYNRSLVGDR